MSTAAEFVNLDEFQEAVAAVRNDASDTSYVIVGHVDNDPARVQVVKTGDNVEEIAENMDSSQVS